MTFTPPTWRVSTTEVRLALTQHTGDRHSHPSPDALHHATPFIDKSEQTVGGLDRQATFKENGMQNNKRVGIQTQLQCIAYLHNLGCDISEPIGDNSRYDYIIDVKGKLLKIQCKTSAFKNGAWYIHCASVYTNSKRTKVVKYEKGSVDFFCTMIKGKCYMISIDDTNGQAIFSLRTDNTQNGQKKRVHYAEDYIADTVIERIKKRGSMAQLVSAVGS